LYTEADKVISLAKTNNGFNGNEKRAGPAPRPQQRDNNNSFKQKRPFNGNTSSQAYTQRDNSFKQQPQPNTSARDAVCNKCQHKGHCARDCTSTFSTTGKFLGTGAPPANHHWTKTNAANAKAAKKAAMVNTPPQQQRQQPPQQQRQQPPQQQQQQYQKKKKTVGAITLADTSFPPGFSPVRDTPVLDILEGSVSSDFSSCDEYMDASNEDMDASNEGEDVRTVSFTDKVTEQVATSSKPAPWHFGSDELDLDKWNVQKNKRQVQKPTYSETLKGSAPGPSAKPREPLNFVKKKKRNTVRR
jgi:hypothetical protein